MKIQPICTAFFTRIKASRSLKLQFLFLAANDELGFWKTTLLFDNTCYERAVPKLENLREEWKASKESQQNVLADQDVVKFNFITDDRVGTGMASGKF